MDEHAQTEPPPNPVDIPGIVRVIVQENSGTGEHAENGTKSKVIGDFPHRGALDADVLRSLIVSFEGVVIEKQLLLGRIGDSNTLEFAETMHSLIHWECGIDALNSGSYINTARGEKTPGMLIPGAEVIVTGGSVGGEPVTVSIILSYAVYPNLKHSREQLDVMKHLNDWKLSQNFNALPEPERRRKADQIAKLLQKPNRTSGELQYIYETIGYNVDLDIESGTVLVKPLMTRH